MKSILFVTFPALVAVVVIGLEAISVRAFQSSIGPTAEHPAWPRRHQRGSRGTRPFETYSRPDSRTWVRRSTAANDLNTGQGEKSVELLKTDDFVFRRIQPFDADEEDEEEEEDGFFDDFLLEVDDDDDEGEVIEMEDDDSDMGGLDMSNLQLVLDNLKVSSKNVSYFYLRDELGISEEGMWKITYEAGSVLGMTIATVRRKVQVLRDNMNLSDQDLRQIIERQPTILQLSADKNIAPTILFLVRALDLGRDELRLLLLVSPSILSYRQSNLKSKINFFTRLMDFSVRECRELLLAEPKLIRGSVRTGLVPRMRFLVRDMGISMENLRIIVKKNPRILLYSLDDNLIPKLIFYCVITLSMELKQVEKLLLSYPNVLDYNLERHTLPITRYFIQDLEVSPTEFRGILLKFPRLLTHSLSKIKHLVGYLRYELGLSASQVKRVLYQAPQVIGLNTDNTLKAKVEFLRSSFDLDDDQLRSVVAGMPTLLVLSIENNLQPKTEYLRQAFDHDTLKAAILKLPTLLGYSLDKRIRPRLEAILDAGLDPSRITVGIPMSQEKFEGWLHRRELKARSEERSNKLSGVLASGANEPNLKSDRSGRIVHWSGPRTPSRDTL